MTENEHPEIPDGIIVLNPGHVYELQKYLQFDPDSLVPEYLASLAMERNQVEIVLSMLSQELGNGALTIQFLELMVTKFQKLSENVSKENVDEARESLRNFRLILKKGTQNAKLITQCLLHLQASNAFFSQESLKHVEKIKSDYQFIQNILQEKGDFFKKSYQESWEKVENFRNST